ncbi:MAG: prolyl oligopeptidase family serine peptidase [Terriglobia bacterium]
MRKTHLLHLIAISLAAPTAVWIVSPGRAQPQQAPRPTDEITGSQGQTSNRATFALQGTALLTSPVTDDIREEQRQQIIRYFTSQIAATPAKRDLLWRPDFSSPSAYRASVQKHRVHLREMLGLIEPKLGTPQINVLREDANLRVEDVTLPMDSDLGARALVFFPRPGPLVAGIIAIPPATESREAFAGVMEGATPAAWLKTLLDRNVAVAVPITVERTDDHPICRQAGGKDRRRVLWRAGFIVGRTLVGMEVQQALAIGQFLATQTDVRLKNIAIMGEGQGGMTALFAGALDEQFAAVASLDYFQQRENCWREPVDQVLYGQLKEFGDAEVAALIAPRPLIVVRPSGNAIHQASVSAEFARAQRFYGGLHADHKLQILDPWENPREAMAMKLATLLGATEARYPPDLALQIPRSEVQQARDQHFESWFQYLQNLIAASSQAVKNYWQLDSTPAAERPQKAQRLRAELAQLVGVISIDKVPMNARTALVAETDKFLAYDAFLDVVPGVEVYGQLLIPRAVGGAMPERRPAVVCQHGFGGAPKYVSGVGDHLESNDHYYHRFGQRLAERGYVVFAPYLTVPEVRGAAAIVHRADLVNPLVRLAAPLGMMRTGVELAKLHRVVDFLQSLSFVDPEHIGYYGLSYGGYSAMWMPPLEPRLKLTMISAFFNDWRTMLTDTSRYGQSYWTLPDEDFYNWNVLNRFTHTEMIAAMWPRPVAIEYGSEDQVTTLTWHQRAWQQANAFAEAWGMQDKIVDDEFIGPHTIHGIGTFFFLDRWLRPERAAGRDYGCRDDDYCYQNLAPGFHGYDLSSTPSAPFAAQLLDSNPAAVIRGQFYVPAGSPVFTGMAFKLARTGNPGNLIVRFGSREGAGDLGEALVLAKNVYPQYDLWYEAALTKPLRLDPTKPYCFELKAESGHGPDDGYVVFGPQPLGGRDYPAAFGLSFRTLTRKGENL